MKIPNFKTTVGALCILFGMQLASLPAYAYTLQISGRDTEHSEYYGYENNQTGNAKIFVSCTSETDDNGYVISQTPYISGIEASSGTSILLPEGVAFASSIGDELLSGKTFSLSNCFLSCYSNDENASLTDLSVTIPDCYTHIDGFDGSGPIRRLIFESSTPPIINVYNDSNVPFKIIVNDDAVSTYRSKCDNEEDGWHSFYSIFPKNYRDAATTVVSATPGNLYYEVMTKAEESDLRNIYNLKITGSIQPSDMNVFRLLENLISLDLSEATVNMSDEDTEPYIMGCQGMSWLETVTLSSGIKRIYQSSFRNCTNLQQINLDNIVTIDEYAFFYCHSLAEIDIPEVKSIGDGGFYGCHNLRNVTGGRNLSDIYHQAFSQTALESFDIPFGCRVGDYVFEYSSIRELIVRDNSNISNRSFQSMDHLEALKCYDPCPYHENLNMDRENSEPITLYVPEFALDFYNTEVYQNFMTHKPLEEDIDFVNVVSTLDITTTRGIAAPASFNLHASGESFINRSQEPLSISKLTQDATYKPAHNYGIEIQIDPTSAFISDGEVTVDDMDVNLWLLDGSQQHQAWNFISFPFDVKLDEIKTPQDALWTVMRYDGKIRASRNESEDSGQSAWVKLDPTKADDAVMHAGQGYILHYVLTSDNHWSSENSPFTFSWAKNTGNGTNTALSNQDVTVPLEENKAIEEFEHNTSWNLVGNPYDAFFLCRHNIKGDDGTDYTTPITVWRNINGNYTYEAFSLVDDEFALRPFEAFFVQKLTGSDLTFKKEGRHTAENINDLVNAPSQTEPSTRSAVSAPRSIFNLHISGACGADRTRLVVNDEASSGYEIACDASKFFSMSDAPQIFMTEGSVSYAIDERPYGNGSYSVGVRLSNPGKYTISADSRDLVGYDVELVDNKSGKVTDLGEEDYVFTSDAINDNSRFELRLTPRGSGVDNMEESVAVISVEGSQISVVAAGCSINIYGIDGKTVAEGTGSLEVTLPAGVYVVKAGNMVKKVVVGK